MTQGQFQQALLAAGFVAIGAGQPDRYRLNGAHAYAIFTDSKGLALPTVDDWAVTVWRANDGEEADTDIQHDDDGADLAEAISIAAERVAQLDAETPVERELAKWRCGTVLAERTVDKFGTVLSICQLHDGTFNLLRGFSLNAGTRGAVSVDKRGVGLAELLDALLAYKAKA